MPVKNCPLCETDGGLVVFQGKQFRIIQADESGFPAFYRVVWTPHVGEFSDLTAAERDTCMQAVVAVEQLLREHMQPDKINLASLGNAVPHLHWHVIARFGWDSHFPAPVWGNAQREPDPARLQALALRCADVNRLMAGAMVSS